MFVTLEIPLTLKSKCLFVASTFYFRKWFLIGTHKSKWSNTLHTLITLAIDVKHTAQNLYYYYFSNIVNIFFIQNYLKWFNSWLVPELYAFCYLRLTCWAEEEIFTTIRACLRQTCLLILNKKNIEKKDWRYSQLLVTAKLCYELPDVHIQMQVLSHSSSILDKSANHNVVIKKSIIFWMTL